MAARTFDALLADHGLTIVAGSIQKSDVTAAIPRVAVATESKRRSDFSELDTIGQFSAHHGQGQYLFEDEAAIMESNFVDTRVKNQWIPAPLRHDSTVFGTTTFPGEAVDMIYSPGHAKLYALCRGTTTAENNLYSYNTTFNRWEIVAGASALLQAANCQPHKMAIFAKAVAAGKGGVATSEVLVISRNAPTISTTTALDYIYSTDGVVFAAGPATASKASLLVTFKEHIAYDTGNTTVMLRPDPTATTAEIAITGIGSEAEKITGMLEVNDRIVVFKPGRMYVISWDGTAYIVTPFLQYAWGRSDNNGEATTIWNNSIYWNIMKTVYAGQGTTTRNVGPELGATEAGLMEATPGAVARARFGDSTFKALQTDKRGSFTGIVGTANWLYGAVDGSVIKTIQAYNGVGWHEMTQLRYGESGGVWFTPVLDPADAALGFSLLWYRDGTRLSYLILSEGTEDRWDFVSSDYENVGVPNFITSWFDIQLPEVDKDWLWLNVELDHPGDASTLTIKYQVDYDTTWYMLGTIAASGKLFFPANNAKGNVQRAKAIRYTYQWNMASSIATIRLKGYFANFISRPPVRFGWKLQVVCADNNKLVDGSTDTRTAERIAALLADLRSLPGPVRWDDGRCYSGNYNYLLNPSFDGWTSATVPINWSEFGHAAVTINQNAQYTYDGGFAAKVVTTGNGSEQGITSAGVSMPAGDLHGVIRVYVESGAAAVFLTRNGVPVGATTVSAPTVADDWDLLGVDLFERVSFDYTNASTATFAIVVRGNDVNAVATFYVDAGEIREGDDDESPFIGPHQPRCFMRTPSTPYSTVSYRPPFWLVYVSALGERYDHARIYKDNTEAKQLSYQSRMTLDLREAW